LKLEEDAGRRQSGVMLAETQRVEVLGVGLRATDYAGGIKFLEELAQRGKPGMVTACNTHLVALARQQPEFGKILEGFDLLLPDGMPLVWAMRKRGAAIKDRVYGPYLMQEALKKFPRPWKHFFFGGTERCLEELVVAARKIQPHLEVAGILSPPFRNWTEEDEQKFAEQIRTSQADFIWVALGGGRQEEWIAKNSSRHSRGVFLAVGDAFELLAGRRPFAPRWMQKAGLTWLYRLCQEPRRLLTRYLKYNSLFVYYSLMEKIPSFGKRRG
jgi:N-acetylglucosaminyldiphosphoundecaprenol N-acetyl-beta-D-mannosaminyltransferase